MEVYPYGDPHSYQRPDAGAASSSSSSRSSGWTRATSGDRITEVVPVRTPPASILSPRIKECIVTVWKHCKELSNWVIGGILNFLLNCLLFNISRPPVHALRVYKAIIERERVALQELKQSDEFSIEGVVAVIDRGATAVTTLHNHLAKLRRRPVTEAAEAPDDAVAEVLEASIQRLLLECIHVFVKGGHPDQKMRCSETITEEESSQLFQAGCSPSMRRRSDAEKWLTAIFAIPTIRDKWVTTMQSLPECIFQQWEQGIPEGDIDDEAIVTLFIRHTSDVIALLLEPDQTVDRL